MSDFLFGLRRAALSLALAMILLAACERNTTPTAPPQTASVARTTLAEKLYDANASREERNQCWEKLRLIFGRAAHRKDFKSASVALTEALGSDSSALRRAALLALESELGAAELRAQLEPLAALLWSSAKRAGPAHEGPAVLRILARLGPELAPLREAIQACLDLDPQASIRALILMGPAAEPARPELEARLLSADHKLRQLCHEALLGLTPPGISAPGLENILATIRGGEQAGDLTSALQALSELSAAEQSAHQSRLAATAHVLTSRLGDRSEAIVIASCEALSRCPAQPEGKKSLAQVMRHNEASVRRAAARALFALEAWIELASALSDQHSQNEVAALLPLLPKGTEILVDGALDMIVKRRADAALRAAFKDLIRVAPSLVGEVVSGRWRVHSQRPALASVLLQLPAEVIAGPVGEALDSDSPRLQLAALHSLTAAKPKGRPSVSIERVRELSSSSDSDVRRLALRALTQLDTSLEQASTAARRFAAALKTHLSVDGQATRLVELRQLIIALSELRPDALETSAEDILQLSALELPSEDPYIAKLFLQLAASKKLSSEHSRLLLESSIKRLGSEDQAASRLQWLRILGALASVQSDLVAAAKAELSRNAIASFAPGRLVAIQELGRLRALPELLKLLPQVQANERGATWKAISEATEKSTATSQENYQIIKADIDRGIEAAEAGPALAALARTAPQESRSELIAALKARLGGPTWSAALEALRGLQAKLDHASLAKDALQTVTKGEAAALRVFCLEGFSSESRELALGAARTLIQSEWTRPESLPPAFQLLSWTAQEGDLADLLSLALDGSPPRDSLAAQALRDCRSSASVPLLCRLLSEGPAAQRAATATALAEPRGAPPAEPNRLKALKTAAMLPGEAHSEAALSALLQLAPKSEEAGEALNYWLRSAIHGRVEVGLRALCRYPIPSSSSRLQVLRQLGERYEHLRELAFDALAASRDS